ncbi:MAG: rod shape-determining protein MreC [Prevotellaceae bacterium]|jgi:rod shape-determining protein MreC|nr:rod shape-determining protein MreC [Prevotellaceae bacterium]
MGNLLRLLLRYHGFILFFLLESVAFVLLSHNSYYQQTQLFGAVQVVQSAYYSALDEVTAYVSLKEENEVLSHENARLRNMLDHFQSVDTAHSVVRVNPRSGKLYSYIPAKVVNSTTNKQNNYLVLNVGEWQNVTPEMGVVTNNGVVGVVISTSARYATVMSLLNREFKISARLKRTGYLGTLEWDGISYREAVLTEVPQHVNITVGDTVETSGYSAMFPEGILIGTVVSYETKKGNFHEVRVRLEVDFKKLRHVNAVQFVNFAEQREHERKYDMR